MGKSTLKISRVISCICFSSRLGRDGGWRDSCGRTKLASQKKGKNKPANSMRTPRSAVRRCKFFLHGPPPPPRHPFLLTTLPNLFPTLCLSIPMLVPLLPFRSVSSFKTYHSLRVFGAGSVVTRCCCVCSWPAYVRPSMRSSGRVANVGPTSVVCRQRRSQKEAGRMFGMWT